MDIFPAYPVSNTPPDVIPITGDGMSDSDDYYLPDKLHNQR